MASNPNVVRDGGLITELPVSTKTWCWADLSFLRSLLTRIASSRNMLQHLGRVVAGVGSKVYSPSHHLSQLRPWAAPDHLDKVGLLFHPPTYS